MKLYRVECHRDSDFSRTYWTTDLEKAKQDYEKEKDGWYDDEDEDGYVSSYWHTKIEMKAGGKDEL